MIYPIALEPTESGVYGVVVPDMPGCVTVGSTVDEAMLMAREAIELHLEGFLDEGLELPDPTPIHQLRSDPEYAGMVWAFIDVNIDRRKRVA